VGGAQSAVGSGQKAVGSGHNAGWRIRPLFGMRDLPKGQERGNREEGTGNKEFLSLREIAGWKKPFTKNELVLEERIALPYPLFPIPSSLFPISGSATACHFDRFS